MKELTIKITDENKLGFLLELLSQFEFVEFEKKYFKKHKQENSTYDFFKSAGLFEGRDINAIELRKQAWRIPS